MSTYIAPKRSNVLLDIPFATRQRIVDLVRRGVEAAEADRVGERAYAWDDKVMNCAVHAAVEHFARLEFADEIAAGSVRFTEEPGFLVLTYGRSSVRWNKLTKRKMPARNKTRRSKIVHGEKQGCLFEVEPDHPLSEIEGYVFAGWLLDPKGKAPPAIYFVVPSHWSLRLDHEQDDATATVTGETFSPEGGARRIDDAAQMETGTE